jgi:subtilisin family serine protease
MFNINRLFAGALATALALALALWAPPGVAHADDDDTQDGFVPNEVVIKLLSTSDLAGIGATFNLTLLEQFGARPVYRMRITDGAQPPDKASMLSNDARVLYAEPNFEFQAPESRARSKPGWVIGDGAGDGGMPWAPGALRLNEAHSVSRGAGVRVAVLDTGVDMAHPTLAGKLIAGYDFVDDDADPREQGTVDNYAYGHGTHVAGLVAQVAPDARIMPVRVLDPDGVGNIWVLAEALAYAVDPDANPQTDDGAHVINLSLGTTRRTDLLEDLLEDAACDDDEDDEEDEDEDDERCLRFGGAVVVAAAGNLGNETPHFPAAEQEVRGLMAVAATTPGNTLASFSSRGPWVQVAAPGERIVSSVPGGGTGVWSGTSMAAPLTAGVAALTRAHNPSLKPADTTSLIASTAAPLCGASLKQVDAAAALGLGQASQPRCQINLPVVSACPCPP